MARQIARTPEGRRRFVDDLYQRALGRPADAAGLSYWSGRLVGGTSESAVIAGVFGSGEFVARAGGSPEAFIDALYPALLGRPADAGGRAYWVSRLGAGSSPIQVALAFATGTEGLGVRTALVYQQMLGRAPTGAERTSGAAAISSSGEPGLIAAIAATTEYFDRAQLDRSP